MNRVSSLKMKGLSLLLAVALAVAALPLAVSPALATAPVHRLWIAPPTQTVAAGDTFTVKVMQDTPGGSNSAESDFEFNHGLVKITGVARGKPYADKGATLMPGKMGEAIAEANLDGSLNTVAAICGFGVFVDKGPQEFLVITMEAKADVTGTHTSDLTLTRTSIFDTAYVQRRPPVTNGKVIVQGPPDPMPDLIVETVTTEWVVKGEIYNVTFTIKNIGNAVAIASTAAVYIDGTEVATEAIGALAAGATAEKTVGPFTFTAPEDIIKVVADSGKVVAETNEPNNEKAITLHDVVLAVAIIGDWEGQLETLLDDAGHLAEPRGWDVIEDMADFDAVVVNRLDGDPGEEIFSNFLTEAENHGVGLLFTGSWPWRELWGIRLLQLHLGDPAGQGDAYKSGPVFYKITKSHPIFAGWAVGEEVTIIDVGWMDHAWFVDYSGLTAADIGSVKKGVRGGGMGFTVLENNAHLLLAGLGPQRWTNVPHWTDAGRTIFVRGVEWVANPPRLTLDPPEGAEGHEVTVSGVNFPAGAVGAITATPEGIIAPTEFRADGNGEFTVPVTILTSAPRGETIDALFLATTIDEVVQATAPFTVAEPFDFSLAVAPTEAAVAQGEGVTAAATATLEAGITERVDLMYALPDGVAGIEVSFVPTYGEPTFTSNMTITAAADATVGKHVITITATGAGGVVETVPFTLTTVEALVVRIEGSTTVKEIADLAEEPFEGIWADTVVSVAGGGSGAGISKILADQIDIGMASRELTTEQARLLNAYVIARDAVCVVVRAGTAMAFIDNITIAQLKWIYERGAAITTTRWSEIPGAGANWPTDKFVVPRARNIGSGTRAELHAFCGIVPALEESTITATGLLRLGSNSDMVTAIKANDFQIGYVGLGYIKPGIRALNVGGVMPSVATVRDGTYPLSRSLYLLTLKSDPTPNARADDFINYMFTAAGQAHVTAAGFVPVPVVNPMIADFDVNKNKAVSAADIMLVYLNWGTTGEHNDVMHLGWIRADVNNDGAVGAADIMLVYLNWGKKAPW